MVAYAMHTQRGSVPLQRHGSEDSCNDYKGKNLRQKLFTYNPRKAYPDEIQNIMRQIE